MGSTVLNPQVTSFLSNRDATNNAANPKAYLNIVLLDEQLNPVITSDGKNSYFKQVSADTTLETLSVTDRDITKNGYVYIYVSNETPNIDVIFDNLQVSQTRGPLLEETHYYPFGLTMAGISSKAAGKLDNHKKYNGIEFDEDLDLDTYEAFYRNLDPQTGRWWQVDPKTEGQENMSPYSSMSGDPIRYSDPLGDVAGDEGDEGFWASARTISKSLVGNVAGAVVGGFDNIFGANARNSVASTISDPDVARGWNSGLNAVDALSIVGGVMESSFGTGVTEASVGVTVVTGGLSLEVKAPAAGLGAGLAFAWFICFKKWCSKFNFQNGRVDIHGNSSNSEKTSGNYQNTHESGKTYNGVGDKTRMNQSANNIATKHNDPVVKQVWKKADNKLMAYIREHLAIQRNGGAGNKDRNYNIRTSPGKKLYK